MPIAQLHTDLPNRLGPRPRRGRAGLSAVHALCVRRHRIWRHPLHQRRNGVWTARPGSHGDGQHGPGPRLARRRLPRHPPAAAAPRSPWPPPAATRRISRSRRSAARRRATARDRARSGTSGSSSSSGFGSDAADRRIGRPSPSGVMVSQGVVVWGGQAVSRPPDRDRIQGLVEAAKRVHHPTRTRPAAAERAEARRRAAMRGATPGGIPGFGAQPGLVLERVKHAVERSTERPR